jgi:4'-phosphopantetheinyl transferase
MKPKIFIARGISSIELLDSVFDRYNIKDRTLKYEEYGKPYLASGDLFFNLSHCGDMVVCAVCDREVGVDIQRIDYRKNVINKVCSQEEAAEIRTPEDFTKMWVLKESFAKCDGRGLSYGLKNINTKNLKDSEVFQIGDFLVATCYNTR